MKIIHESPDKLVIRRFQPLIAVVLWGTAIAFSYVWYDTFPVGSFFSMPTGDIVGGFIFAALIIFILIGAWWYSHNMTLSLDLKYGVLTFDNRLFFHRQTKEFDVRSYITYHYDARRSIGGSSEHRPYVYLRLQFDPKAPESWLEIPHGYTGGRDLEIVQKLDAMMKQYNGKKTARQDTGTPGLLIRPTAADIRFFS
ncbi:hypothetical protein [Halocynthiibacter namhaensis]|uniref:hypothetical protein n=1 Tax=Halocynthiibacter namhaensis TaxID=1290553 RepID=UPI00057974CF|nr:hypothetical protein [Halocynthiibacter namhaensis]